MTPARLPNWRERLSDFMGARLALGFDWAERNCGFFAADALEAQTGWDMFACFRGGCSNQFGALRILRREGFRSVAEFIAARTPLRWGPGAVAELGDLILYPHAPLDWLVVADGRGNIWAQDARRVRFLAAPDGGQALRLP